MSDDRDMLAAVLESTSALVVVLDRDGAILKFNLACELVSGYSSEEVVGRRLADLPLIPEGDRAAVAESLADPDPSSFPRTHEGTWRSRGEDLRRVAWTDTAIAGPGGGVEAIVRTGVDVTERRRAERRLATQLETMRVLAGSVAADEAIRGCLEAITRGLGLEVGEYWALDEAGGVLRLAANWHRPRPALDAFEAVSRGFAFGPGEGLPGRIWVGGTASWWADDMSRVPLFRRSNLAAEFGLCGGFGFPVADGGDFLGVMTFYTDEVLSSDQALIETMAGLGVQIGEFLRRRRAEEELARSEARKAAILEAALDGIISVDHEGRIVEFNPAAERTFGHARGDALGKSLAEFFAPGGADDGPGRDARRLLEAGRGAVPRKPVELQALRAGGETFPAEVTMVPVVLGDRPGFVSCIRDIGERKRADLSLRQSEQRLRTVVTEAPLILFAVDPEGTVTFSEGKGLAALGIASKDVIGRSVFDIHRDDPQILDDLRRALAGEAFVVSTSYRGLEFETHYSPLRGPLGENLGLLGVGVDVTQRRRAEERLRIFAALVENSGDFIAMGDLEGRTTYVNPAGRALVGLETPEEVAATTMGDFLTEEPRGRAESQVLPAVLANGQWVGGGRLRHFRTGREIDVQVNLFLVRDPQTDAPLCIAGIARDVTERARAEEELRRAKEAAEAGSRAKSEFLANMSHEIRTPLTAILGSADMLQDPLVADDRREQAFWTINRNGEHLLGIIKNILDLSKLEAERDAPEIAPASPVAVLAEVISTLNVLAREKGVDLSARAQGPIPRTFETDAVRLRQILDNLVANALKFTPEGKVDIRLRLEPGDAGPSRWLLFEVRDEGIGMTPEQVAQIFTPFYQADGSHTRLYGGTGLGLSISRRLAESLGGGIVVESVPGAGSRFTLRLPVAIRSRADLFEPGEGAFALLASPATPAGPSPSPLHARVLLVEDSKDNQRVLIYYLERLGLSVDLAENGRDAVEMGMSRPYDLILMDIQMPELDGYGATRLLRQRGFRGPIVALTAHAMAGDSEKCLAAGCNDYLRKPVEQDRLARVLHRLLGPQGPAAPPRSGTAVSPASVAPAPPSELDEEGPLFSEFAGDAGFMELVRDFVADLPDQVARMRTLFADDRLADLARLGHNLRGSGGMFGYMDLSELAGLLEDAIREEQERSLVGDLVDELAGIVRRIGLGLETRGAVSRS